MPSDEPAAPPTAPTKLRAGPPVVAGDATLIPEIHGLAAGGPASARTPRGTGVHIRIEGVEVEEAFAMAPRRGVALLDLAALVEVAGVLRDGARRELPYSEGGRLRRLAWSLEPPSPVFPSGQDLWFYPLSQDRRVLRVALGPLREGLRRCLAWLRTQPELPAALAARLEGVERALGTGEVGGPDVEAGG